MVPLQIIGDPSAVRRQTPLEEVDFGPGNTETEALHNSGSGSGSGSGSSSEKLAGRKGRSTCRTASFPTLNSVSGNDELCYHASYGTNRVLEKQEVLMKEQELEIIETQERDCSWWLQH